VQYIFCVDQLLMQNLPNKATLLLEWNHCYKNSTMVITNSNEISNWSFPFQVDVFCPLSPSRLLPRFPMSNRSCWLFGSTWVHPWFFGGVRAAYIFSFLCCAFCFICFLSLTCAQCLWLVLSVSDLCSVSPDCPFLIPLPRAFFSLTFIYIKGNILINSSSDAKVIHSNILIIA
jgi:hypothetical protein